MRGFECHYFAKNEKNELIKNTDYACWAGIRKLPAGSFIYIDQYENEETKQYIDLLINTINKITSCKIVEIDKKEYIEFKLLQTYDQSLVLLNFIRNLWHAPGGTYYDYTTKAIKIKYPEYIDKFFHILKETSYKDPLAKLTDANKQACFLENPKTHNFGFSPGHSNVHKEDTLKIKYSKDLFNFNGLSTMTFLTT